MAAPRCLNINVGVMGHVDSGKTKLVEQLSTVLSTAALDKHPQSLERGITLDLGFSALRVPLPERLSGATDCTALQFTLMDCPGHASLIRTVLGGSHIMDMMILVIDITKGIQVQTAECLVIGEITVDKILVVLNKTDLIPEDKLDKIIQKAEKRVLQTLKMTSFKSSKILPVSAKTGAGMDRVAEELTSMVEGIPERRMGPLLFAIDHCFRIKGQGTVLTGTVLQGTVHVQDTIELPVLKESRRVKSIQMFKTAVVSASAGDRAGICVANLDPSRIERGLAATPGSVQSFKIGVAAVQKVRFYADTVTSGQKLHIMLGHAMAVAKCTFLKPPLTTASTPSSATAKSIGYVAGLELSQEYQFMEELLLGDDAPQLVLMQFEVPMTAPMGLSLVGARLDGVSDVQSCRMALHGKLLESLQPQQLQQLKIYKLKQRHGVMKQVFEDGKTAVGTEMFKKETDFSHFLKLPVVTENGDQGLLLRPHGREGDFLVEFEQKLQLCQGQDTPLTLFSKKYITP